MFKKRLHKVLTVSEMQSGFKPVKETIDAVFTLIRLQEEYHAKGKSSICVPREKF